MAALSLAVVGMLGAGLILGLGVVPPVRHATTLVSVTVALPKPPPPPQPTPPPPERMASRLKGDPSPRNLRNKATQVVAPPVVPLIVPPPVVTAPIENVGTAANTGASDRPGPGQGAGGIGNGFGGGGNGGNGDGEAVVGPRLTRGRLAYDDLPQGVLADGEEAAVQVLYTVLADGTVAHCRIARSSGYPAIDQLACRLIEQRFRYRPARDSFGRAVPAQVIATHSWIARES